MKKPSTATKLDELRKLLQECYDHLEYCGWGDKWERECATESKLPERVQKALEDDSGLHSDPK